MKQKLHFCKRWTAFILVLVMVLTTVNTNLLTVSASGANSGASAVSSGDSTSGNNPGTSFLNLETCGQDWYVGSEDGWGSAAATLDEQTTKATIVATSFGSEGSQWQLQYKVKDLGIDTSKTYKVEFDITSTVDKKVHFKLDNKNGLLDETLTLTAGQKLQYSKEQSAGSFSDEAWLVFGLGQFAGETANQAGTITIENVRLTEVTLTPANPEETNDGNVIANGDFSSALNSSTDWDFWTGEGGAATYQLNGNDGIDISVTAEGGQQYAVQLTQAVALEEGVTYDFSCDMYSATDAQVVLNIQETLGWGGIVDAADMTQNLTAGQVKHVSFTTSAASANFVTNGKLAMMFGSGTGNAGKTITISNVKLTPTVDNIIVNGDFSSALNSSTDWDFWTGEGGAATYQLNGNGGIDISVTAEGGQQYAIQLTQALALEEGATYDFSCDMYSATDAQVVLNIQETLGWGGIVDAADMTQNLTAGQVKHVSFTTSAASANFVTNGKLALMFGSGTGNTGKTITISNVKLAKTSGETLPPSEKGKEYDFTATADNAAKDCPDPGKTKTGYDLIWADEFNGNYGSANVDASTGLNLDNWAYQLGDGTTDCSNPGWGNKELQCYTGNTKNIAVNEDLNGDGNGEGMLRITASYEADGYTYADESSKSYTSARIRSTKPNGELFNTTYGYVEARISLPETQGAWPAFWMLPQSTSIYGGWPLSGEIDIMETTGKNVDSACGTLHYGAPDHVYRGSGYVTLAQEVAYFHTYAVDWQPGSMTWYYDGVPIYTSTNWETGTLGASDTVSFDAPFDQPFYILLNLAVDSGQFGGGANKATFQDDINMYVDYVRVYQKTDGYPAYAERTASSGVAEDWADYAGQNQIAAITATNVLPPVKDATNDGSMDDVNADANNWYLSYQSDVSSSKPTITTVKDTDGTDWAKITIGAAGSLDYSVQMIGHYNAKAGYVYKLSFDAYAEGDIVGKKVASDSKEWSGWTAYGAQSFELSAQPTRISYMIEQTESFDKCRMEFNLGAAGTGTVYIGNVKVEIVDPALLGGSADEEDTTRTPLSNGNVIYNGTFDQGSKYIGYWSAYQGTTLVVPRYTTTKIGANDVSVVDVASKTNYEKIADGVKYYERRAQISADSTVAPIIYQNGMKLIADTYELAMDVYSAKDTKVTAAIYSTKEDGSLDTMVKAAEIQYKATEGVRHLVWSLTLDNTVENAALVLKFDKGAAVQVDNITMIGASQGETVDETPLTSTKAWSADNGAGAALTLEQNGNVYTLSNVESNSGAWYTPQIKSATFSLVSGKEYELKLKYKIEGQCNNTVQYIIQEQNGGWYSYIGDPITLTYDASKADADGFCSYQFKFTAGQSLSTVAMGFGLGNSGSNGTADFSFKDVTLTLVQSGDDASSADTWTPVTTDILKDDVTPGQQPGQQPGQDSETEDDSTLKVEDSASGLPSFAVPSLGTMLQAIYGDANKENVDVVFEVENIGSLNSTEQNLIAGVLDAGQMIGACFDISLFANGVQITDLKSAVELTIGIAPELRKTGRTFYVYNIHNGVAKLLPVTESTATYIKVLADGFSTFVLVYEDTQNNGNGGTPNNGNTTNTTTTQTTPQSTITAAKTEDTTRPYMWAVWALVAGVILLGATKVYFMKKEQEEEAEA